MLSVGLEPEYIFSFLSIPITNTFFSSLLVSLILSSLAVLFYLKRQTHQSLAIKALCIFIYEMIKFTDKVTKNRELTKKILPLIATFFLFIVTANLFALVPGFLGSFYLETPTAKLPLFRSPNSDLTTTLALAIFAVLSIQYFSLKALGFKKYAARFLTFANPVKFVLGFFELLSESVKVLSFSFRLFGNIFAGEILLLIIAFLVPLILPVAFLLMEVFVGIIQAFIFAMLTLTFIKISTMPRE